MTDFAASFKKPFPEQLAAFRLRLGNLVPTSAWDDLKGAGHDRGFMVAGAMKADLLTDIGLAVDRAISEGTGLKAFHRDFLAIAKKRGWHGWTGEGTKGGEAWRTRVIYQTNMRTSYMAGRFAQLKAGKFKYWVYRHGGSLQPRVQHLAWDGLILAVGHAFWAKHYPPNDWGCSCRVFGARSLASAKRKGGIIGKTLAEGWQNLDRKTGTPPGIGKGWDHVPGGSVAETVSLAAQKIQGLPAEIGTDFGTSLSDIIDRYWPVWVADTLVGGSHAPALVGVLGRAEISALGGRGIAPKSAEILMRPGLLNGPKAARHSVKGDALRPQDWISLPSQLRQPVAVLLDTKTGNLLYILKGVDGRPQLAVSLDYNIRIGRDTKVGNVVVSAYQAPMESIASRVKSGLLIVVVGKIR